MMEKEKEIEIILHKHGFTELKTEGQGAFAWVYRVKSRRDGGVHACKVARGAQAGEILAREAGLLGQLAHPLFAAYEDYFTEMGYGFLVMEYVEGMDFEKVLKSGAIGQRQAAMAAAELAEGLKYLHERPGTVLYRDLKPGNIRIMPEGKVRLVDLGCACRMEEARYSRAGSRGYAAPEQLGNIGGGRTEHDERGRTEHGERGRAENDEEGQAEDTEMELGKACCGPYSDVFALGKLMHYMLTGEDPCRPPYRKQPIRAYDRSLSPLLEQLVERCTERDPRKRPQDMRSVLKQLAPFCKEPDLGFYGREAVARLKCACGGGCGEAAFVFQKNICKFPDFGELAGEKGVL